MKKITIKTNNMSKDFYISDSKLEAWEFIKRELSYLALPVADAEAFRREALKCFSENGSVRACNYGFIEVTRTSIMFMIEEHITYCDGYSCSMGEWSEETNALKDWKPCIYYGLFITRKECENRIAELVEQSTQYFKPKFRVAEIRIND